MKAYLESRLAWLAYDMHQSAKRFQESGYRDWQANLNYLASRALAMQFKAQLRKLKQGESQ